MCDRTACQSFPLHTGALGNKWIDICRCFWRGFSCRNVIVFFNQMLKTYCLGILKGLQPQNSKVYYYLVKSLFLRPIAGAGFNRARRQTFSSHEQWQSEMNVPGAYPSLVIALLMTQCDGVLSLALSFRESVVLLNRLKHSSTYMRRLL
jgi:hypothetical protein